MGCCVSRAADDDENPQNAVAGGSRLKVGNERNLTHQTGKPFKRTGLSWTADTPLSQAQLESQRTIFWDTAPTYEGRPEIWQALRAAITSPDIRMAQSILEAANIIIPTGNPSEGCYDELGNRYVIPVYCLVEPTNLIVPEDEDDQHDDTAGMIASTSVPAQTKDGDDDDLEEEKKASGDMATSTLIPITVRLSTAQDIKVDISRTDETVASLRTRIYMQSPDISPQTHTIRLIYLGRILQEEDRIVCEGEAIPEPRPVVIASGAVMQALVSKK